MTRSLVISARLILCALLHAPLVYFLYQWQYDGRPKGFYLPYELILCSAAVSLLSLLSLLLVFFRGDAVQRLLAIALSILPVFVLIQSLQAAAAGLRWAINS
jgi:hypothetical protein